MEGRNLSPRGRSEWNASPARCASSSPSAAVGRLTCGGFRAHAAYLFAQRAFTLSLATQILLLLLLLLPFPSSVPALPGPLNVSLQDGKAIWPFRFAVNSSRFFRNVTPSNAKLLKISIGEDLGLDPGRI